MISAVTVHASSPNRMDFPLCGAKKFRQVTVCRENVTCEGCIRLLTAQRQENPTLKGSNDAKAVVIHA
jgi:hypothetical protein